MTCCAGRAASTSERVWAIEDCRHVSGALERFLLARGERVVRVAPKLTAGARSSARERGKSDAIDAVAIARAAIREGLDTLPVAQLAGPELDVRLLVDHRERLVAPAHRADQRPALAAARPLARVRDPAARADHRAAGRTASPGAWRAPSRPPACGSRATSCAASASSPARSTRSSASSPPSSPSLAPRLLAERGCGVLTAAKLIGEIAGVEPLRHRRQARPRSPARHRSPPPPDNTNRHRLDRGGNRQLNCALHRLAVTKGRLDPETAAYLARKQAEGKTRREALRCLKRHLARRVWQLLQPHPTRDPHPHQRAQPTITPASITIHCNTPYSRFSLDIEATSVLKLHRHTLATA